MKICFLFVFNSKKRERKKRQATTKTQRIWNGCTNVHTMWREREREIEIEALSFALGTLYQIVSLINILICLNFVLIYALYAVDMWVCTRIIIKIHINYAQPIKYSLLWCVFMRAHIQPCSLSLLSPLSSTHRRVSFINNNWVRKWNERRRKKRANIIYTLSRDMLRF